MSLRDTSWCWNLGPVYSNAISIDAKKGIQKISVLGLVYNKVVDIGTFEWIGLTESAADAFLTNLAADTANADNVAKKIERNRIVGEYGIQLVVNDDASWGVV